MSHTIAVDHTIASFTLAIHEDARDVARQMLEAGIRETFHAERRSHG
jgi:outer membrane PBP1 activator LpoA protein